MHAEVEKKALRSPEGARAGRLALVTVTFNSIAVLPDFLASLDAQTSADWALIAVDNASADASLDLLRAWGGRLHALIANDENTGFARATNQGIERALADGFDAVLLINNDTMFAPGFLEELLNSPHRAAAPVLAPVVLYADAKERCWYAGGHFSWFRGAFQAVMQEDIPIGAGEVWTTDFAPACCLLVEAEVFNTVGLLDERFFVYWEDVDFCWRCRRAGVSIAVLREPTILHKASTLTGGETSAFTLAMWHRNQIAFIRKHFGWPYRLVAPPLMVLKVLLRMARGRESPGLVGRRLRAIAKGLGSRSSAPSGKART